jgi:hypothetical protein
MKPAILMLLALCACQMTESSAPTSEGTDPAASSVPHPSDSTLSPADEPGTVRVLDEPVRPIEGTPSSRVWLLDLYHGALAEKEELGRKVNTLGRERDTAVLMVGELEKERTQLEARCAALDADLKASEAKSLELARRLVESELARLEAEKARLEKQP